MAKDLKLKITNKQLAKAAGLDKLKAKLAGEIAEKEPAKKATPPSKPAAEQKGEPRRIRAKTHSDFAPPKEAIAEEESPKDLQEQKEATSVEPSLPETSLKDQAPKEDETKEAVQETVLEKTPPLPSPPPIVEKHPKVQEVKKEAEPVVRQKLGPTGRHIKDLLPENRQESKKEDPKLRKEEPKEGGVQGKEKIAPLSPTPTEDDKLKDKKGKGGVREFRDFKAVKKQMKPFDARDRAGLSEGDDEKWRKKRIPKPTKQMEEQIIRPTSLKLRLPITVKDLAAAMKLKASELIAKLLMQGIAITLNDVLDDETTVQLLGDEFGCQIQIDTFEEKRIRITDLSISKEIEETESEDLVIRSPVVTFMGHVDHGKTSLIDKIRTSNLATLEAGAITQHMGAFKCHTAVGDITILDTPGHEAFSAMRARGAEVTDIVVLVVAWDEGIKDQTLEAIQHAKLAEVTIVVAINKCDKTGFNPENVYRQLSEQNLLPEVWGGQTITVNTSAVTGEGIQGLLEMLALQAEVLELKANPKMRARGTVLESELQKGLGSVATVLVQNGTLKIGDSIVFERLWGKVKTMRNELGLSLTSAGPSAPVEITGLSGLPSAGDPFIVVSSEKEAREIAEVRAIGSRQTQHLQKKRQMTDLLHAGVQKEKKILKVILRGDVQGSIEALRQSILKIESDKASADVIFTGVGQISQSDIQLAAASKAVIIGFHTKVESHADPLIKELGVTVRLFDIIYHAVDEVKAMMQGLLDKIEEERETGKAEVKAKFKSSQLGVIAGCIVIEGVIHRNNKVRVVRKGEIVWKGTINSLKRVKEDVREVKKGIECGILSNGFAEVQEGDILEAYEIHYLSQKL